MEKEKFLQNIRQQLELARLPEAAADPPPLPELAEPPPIDELVDRFTRELEAVNGHVHLVTLDNEVFAQLDALFEQYQAQGYLGWDEEHLPLAGVHDYLTGRGFNRGQTRLSHELEARRDEQNALAQFEIGVTGALAAVADSGTLMLQMGAGRGRFASLLPVVHIALIKTDQLHLSLNHFIRAYPEINHHSSNTVAVTGPSRTGDIEGVLTLGVHGPKELHVILIK